MHSIKVLHELARYGVTAMEEHYADMQKDRNRDYSDEDRARMARQLDAAHQYMGNLNPQLSLWYVRCQEGDIDLLVTADTPDDVLRLWRSHYNLADHRLPTYIGPVVAPLDAGVIDWPSVNAAPETVHYKPIR